MRTPTAGGVHNPLWASMKDQGVAAPMVRQAVAQSAAAHLEGPLPDIAKMEAGDPAAAETPVGSHSRVRRHGRGQFEFRNERKHELARGRRFCPCVELPVVFGPVLAMPGVSQHENVGKTLRRIDVAIDDVSSDEPDHAEVWGNDVVDKSVGAAVSLDLAERSFAEQADFKLFAERPRVSIGAQATHPVVAAFAELDVAVTNIIVNPQVVGDGTLDGMAKVVLIVSVAVRPSVHGSESGKVPKGFIAHGFSRRGLGGEAEAMHHAKIKG